MIDDILWMFGYSQEKGDDVKENVKLLLKVKSLMFKIQ